MFTVLLTILGCAIVFSVIAWFVADHDFYGEAASAVGGAIVAALFIGTLSGCLIGLVRGGGLPHKQVVTDRQTLVSLHDAAGIEGDFFLASGEIDSVIKIHYVVSTPDGLQFRSMDEENSSVYIVQEPRSDGELDVVENLFSDDGSNNWAINGAHWTKYIFHVPEGSVTTCFELNQAGTPINACQSS